MIPITNKTTDGFSMNILDVWILISVGLGCAIIYTLTFTQPQQLEQRARQLSQRHAAAIARGEAMLVLPRRYNTLKTLIFAASAIAIVVWSYAQAFAWLIDQTRTCTLSEMTIDILFSLIFFGWVVFWLSYLGWSYRQAKRQWRIGEYYPPLHQLPWFKPAIRVKQTANTKQRAINSATRWMAIATGMLLVVSAELRDAMSPTSIHFTAAEVQAEYQRYCH